MAQTSDWARQEEENEVGDWKQQESGDAEVPEAALSDWESEEQRESGAENGEEGGGDGFAEGGDEDSYPLPPEDAKLFVGNLPYDVDHQSLAELFEQAGTVEVAEVNCLFRNDVL